MSLSSSITIRPTQDENIPGVVDVYRQSEDFLSLGPEPVASLEMVKHDIEHSRQEGGVYCCIFDWQNNMIGVVDFVPINFEGHPHTAFISLLMIAAPFRRLGVGGQVVAHVETLIRRSRRVDRILTAVQVNNPQAIRFWQSNGYTIISGPTVQPDNTITYLLCKDV